MRRSRRGPCRGRSAAAGRLARRNLRATSWAAGARYCCLTGVAQMSLNWTRLAQEAACDRAARQCAEGDRVSSRATSGSTIADPVVRGGDRRLGADLGPILDVRVSELGGEILRRRADDGSRGHRGAAGAGRAPREQQREVEPRMSEPLGDDSVRPVAAAPVRGQSLCASAPRRRDRPGNGQRVERWRRLAQEARARTICGARAGAGCATGAATSATAKRGSSSATTRPEAATGRTCVVEVPHINHPDVVALAERLQPDVIAVFGTSLIRGAAARAGAAGHRQPARRALAAITAAPIARSGRSTTANPNRSAARCTGSMRASTPET